MKIYLDDLRPALEGFVHCKTAMCAIVMIMTGKVSFISLDHDLGTDQTGYDVACFIEESVLNESISMPGWTVHSANPVGKKRIEQAMQSAERFYSLVTQG